MEGKDVFRFRGLSPLFFLFESFEFKMSLTLKIKRKKFVALNALLLEHDGWTHTGGCFQKIQRFVES